MAAPSLELREVTKRFGSFTAVNGARLEAQQGEFVVLVGPSGCGKSTLLRLIAGFERATSGTIHIAGQEVNDVDPRHRGIAMVFQSYALYPHMTVAENLAFPLKMHGMAKAKASEAVAKVSGTIGLEGLLDRYPRQLSGGQRQRVAMGRAIVREPSLFLFDEPLSNLDAALRVRMQIEIKDLHRRVGTFNNITLIFVLTGGGPVGMTETLAFRVFQMAFRDYQMGLASAGAVIIFGLNVAFTLAYVRVLRPSADQQ